MFRQTTQLGHLERQGEGQRETGRGREKNDKIKAHAKRFGEVDQRQSWPKVEQVNLNSEFNL